MSPLLFALLGTLFFAAVLKGVQYWAMSPRSIERAVAKRELKAKQGTNIRPIGPESQDLNDPIMCALYEVRLTQQKLVDAGIIEQWELSCCDNENCNNCYVGSIVAATRRPRFVQEREILETPTFNTVRKRTVRNQEVNVPEGVPDYAHAAIGPSNGASDFFEVLWTWTDPDTGKPYGMKSVHPKPSSFVAGYKNEDKISKILKQVNKNLTKYNQCNDCEQIEIENGYGDIVKTGVTYCSCCQSHRTTGDMGPL